ncbi:MAG: cytochrome P450, partial [Actinomycetota bacterium]
MLSEKLQSVPVQSKAIDDISALEFWAQPARVRGETFAALRREQPVSHQNPLTFGLAGMMGDAAPGYWLVTTHELVRAASREPDVFCSGQGILLEDLSFPADLREQIGSFLATDGRRHFTLRKLVSSAFTPRNVARIEEQIAGQAHRLVDRLIETGDCDFVAEIATPLPLWTISEMVGVPDNERDTMVQAANTMIATSDPEFVAQGDTAFMAFIGAAQQIWAMATELAQARRARPADDLMTALVEAELDGQRLTDEEIGAFLTLLAVAGNDTTRNTTSHTMKALSDNPDQW